MFGAPAPASAGPNADGVLLLHANENLVRSVGNEYCYTEAPASFSAIDHPTSGSVFADDDVPANIDQPVDFGTLGFNTEGHRPCSPGPIWDSSLELVPSKVTVYQPCGGSFPVELWIRGVVDLGDFSVCFGYDDEARDELDIRSPHRQSQDFDAGFVSAPAQLATRRGPKEQGFWRESFSSSPRVFRGTTRPRAWGSEVRCSRSPTGSCKS